MDDVNTEEETSNKNKGLESENKVNQGDNDIEPTEAAATTALNK